MRHGGITLLACASTTAAAITLLPLVVGEPYSPGRTNGGSVTQKRRKAAATALNVDNDNERLSVTEGVWLVVPIRLIAITAWTP